MANKCGKCGAWIDAGECACPQPDPPQGAWEVAKRILSDPSVHASAEIEAYAARRVRDTGLCERHAGNPDGRLSGDCPACARDHFAAMLDALKSMAGLDPGKPASAEDIRRALTERRVRAALKKQPCRCDDNRFGGLIERPCARCEALREVVANRG